MQSRRSWPQLTLVQTVVGIALCLLVALMAQRGLDRYTGQATPRVSLAELGLAGIAFAILTHHIAAEASVDEAETSQAVAISLAIVGATAGISALACLNFGQNRFRPVGVLVWTSGLLLTLLYLWLISARPRTGGLFRAWREEKKVWVPASAVVLLAIVLLGAWFRLHLNGEIPRDMTFVLGEEYFDSLAISRGGYSIYFPAGLGREGLFYYSVALLGRLGGVTRETLHLTSALFGTVTIIAVYFLAQELYGRTAGLVAAFLLAVNRWHIVVSRIGFRGVTMPLCTALALHAFVRALRTRRPLDFGWAGVAVGMGLYSYNAFLFVPVVMALGLLLYLLTHGLKQIRLLFPGLMAMVLIAAAIFAPLARYAVENPDKYLRRVRYQVEDMEERKESSPGPLVYFERSLLVLPYRGDGDPHLNVPHARQMGLISGILLVLGLAYALWRWRHGYNALMVIALFLLILPASLSMLPAETPNSLRMCGVIVPAVVLAAVPVALVEQLASHRARDAVPQTARGAVATATVGSRESAISHLPTDPANQAGRSTEDETFGSDQAAVVGRTEGLEDSAAGKRSRGEDAVRVSLTVRTGGRRRIWTWQGRRASPMLWILAVVLVLLFALETSEARQYYFHDYVAHLPDISNYSVAGAMADEIKQFGDLQSVYIPAWPYWFDGSVLQMNVGTDRSWNPNVETLAPDRPPLSTLNRTAMFIINGQDKASLATLRAFFPRGFAQARWYPNGELGFYTFYGEP